MGVVIVSKLPVIEVFGPTIQGEGAAIGLKTMFVRLYGCDYRCKWCDSSFTWDGSGKADVELMDIDRIIRQLKELSLDGCRYVTISGGNPALYGEPVQQLIGRLHDMDKRVIVETQGSLYQEWFRDVDLLTVSPKPPSSGMQPDWEMLDRIAAAIDPGKASIKVVVFDEDDYRFAKAVHRRYPAIPFYLQTGNSDPAQDGDISGRLLRKLEWLFDMVAGDPEMADARVLPQLHALVWGNKRGV